MRREYQYAKMLRKKVPVLSKETLTGYLEELGWKVVFFQEEKIPDLISTFKLKESDLTNLSFIYREQDIKVVFVRSDRSDADILFLLLHEIGHILLGHNLGCLSDEDEDSATIFANQCIKNPGARISIHIKKRHLLYIIIPVVLVIFLLVGGAAGLFSGKSDQIVYMTANGEKYHKKDCIYIQDRPIISSTIPEAEEFGRSPCAICFGE